VKVDEENQRSKISWKGPFKQSFNTLFAIVKIFGTTFYKGFIWKQSCAIIAYECQYFDFCFKNSNSFFYFRFVFFIFLYYNCDHSDVPNFQLPCKNHFEGPTISGFFFIKPDIKFYKKEQTSFTSSGKKMCLFLSTR
jgi:hypothetical protein